MSYVYYPGCDEEVPAHICDDCGDEVEHGRVRSVAFIKSDYLATLIASPIAATWKTGITTDKIFIIPNVLGSADGGTPVEGAGYGDQDSSLTGFRHVVSFKDPNYANNAPFYNAMARSRQYAFAYRTENLTHITDKVVSVVPKAPITEDLNSEVVWDVEVRFSQAGHPVPVDTPAGVFDQCFVVEA